MGEVTRGTTEIGRPLQQGGRACQRTYGLEDPLMCLLPWATKARQSIYCDRRKTEEFSDVLYLHRPVLNILLIYVLTDCCSTTNSPKVTEIRLTLVLTEA